MTTCPECQNSYDIGYEEGKQIIRDTEVASLQKSLDWARSDLEKERAEVKRYRDTADRDALAPYTDDQLRAELDRRANVRDEDYWNMRKRTAKYLCYACGMPDSHHTTDCPTDTDCT